MLQYRLVKKRKIALRDRIKVAWKGIIGTLAKPKYAALAVFFMLAFAVLIFFAINITFYGPLFASRLPIVDKFGLFGTMIGELFGDLFTSSTGLLLLAVSILQGIAIALLVYTIRRNRKLDTSAVGGGAIAMIATALGLGCVPCGTSLILPVLTFLFSSSAYAVADTTSLIVLVVAFGLSLFSLYKLGTVASTHLEMDGQKERKSS